MNNQVELTVSKVDLSQFSEELQQVIVENGIAIYNIHDSMDIGFAFMSTAIDPETDENVILICVEHIKYAKLNVFETEALLWHEIAHIVNGATEEEADDFAISKTSCDVWKSTVRKTYSGIFNDEPTGEFAHRKQYLS